LIDITEDTFIKLYTIDTRLPHDMTWSVPGKLLTGTIDVNSIQTILIYMFLYIGAALPPTDKAK